MGDTIKRGVLFVSVLILLLVPAASTIAGAECPLPRQAAFKRGTVTITQGSRVVRLQVEVAETPEARAQGLMCRTRLDANAGMLFIFDDSLRGSFWMKNTLIPLSIAFIDDRWQILEIQDMAVEPDPGNPVAYYSPQKPYRYALEVNQGFFARHRITAEQVRTMRARVTYRPQR